MDVMFSYLDSPYVKTPNKPQNVTSDSDSKLHRPTKCQLYLGLLASMDEHLQQLANCLFL